MLRHWTIALLLCCLAFRAWAGAAMVAGDGHANPHGASLSITQFAAHPPVSGAPEQLDVHAHMVVSAAPIDCHEPAHGLADGTGSPGCLLCAVCHSPLNALDLPEMPSVAPPHTAPIRRDPPAFLGITLAPDTPPPIA